jgi:hypothetical protein
VTPFYVGVTTASLFFRGIYFVKRRACLRSL